MNTNQEETVCPICLAEPGKDLGPLMPGGDDPECQKHHLFHKECINELIYIRHINKCPVCRRRCKDDYTPPRCDICFNIFKPEEKGALMPGCNAVGCKTHLSHQQCLSEWHQIKCVCPTCGQADLFTSNK